MISHLTLLNDLKQKVREKEITHPDLIHYLDDLLDQGACSFVRIIYERHLFGGENQDILCSEEPFEDFMRRQVFAIHPLAKRFQSDQIWLDFFDKYLLEALPAFPSAKLPTSTGRPDLKKAVKFDHLKTKIYLYIDI